MQIIPAIDLKDHQVVRLSQGKMNDSKVYSSDPLKMAQKWYDEGCRRLHLIDLNGAFEGKAIHFKEVTEISKKLPELTIEIGGGLRNLDTIKAYIDAGVTYCILGTAAVKNPELVFEATEAYPHQIILGIDAKKGQVATEGWDELSQISAVDLSLKFKEAAIESIIYTDISKDGMLQGMNISETQEMVEKAPFPIIASGGLTSLDDIHALKKISHLHGIIAGKALYEGRIELKEAIDLVS